MGAVPPILKHFMEPAGISCTVQPHLIEAKGLRYINIITIKMPKRR